MNRQTKRQTDRQGERYFRQGEKQVQGDAHKETGAFFFTYGDDDIMKAVDYNYTLVKSFLGGRGRRWWWWYEQQRREGEE